MSNILAGKKSWSDPSSGEFKRQVSQFREFISKDHPVFKPEKNRYHLYISLACPWASRVAVARGLLGLTNVISLSIVHWYMETTTNEDAQPIQGWRFLPINEYSPSTTISNGDKSDRFGILSDLTRFKDDINNRTHSFNNCFNDGNKYDFDGTIDHVHGFEFIRDLYYQTNPCFEGRFTVPVLYDLKTKTIVNNESSEILRMFGDKNGLLQFADKSTQAVSTLYPKDLAKEIDFWNDKIYEPINNGVYKTGFAEKIGPYEENFYKLFDSLNDIETYLANKYTISDLFDNAKQLFLVGNQLTEADIRLYVTVVRFDPVYHQHFKCNLKMIRHDYPFIHNWLLKLYYDKSGYFKDTTNFAHIKLHYTRSHKRINPLNITAIGPTPNIYTLDQYIDSIKHLKN
ncbi:glutathione S-transferase [Hanseniaspora valbyensis NRRL Y-1626]|uniref:Glutathione S-transferase n=1 Tax=Hanseniaspora valbyensis NRRL Y-1626 TaxID=766949 RepID=A0A1B7TD72_9ASCO|nr:glutathione S-transferase [Hanseniaspora valbyensis NRRL Y-1626]